MFRKVSGTIILRENGHYHFFFLIDRHGFSLCYYLNSTSIRLRHPLWPDHTNTREKLAARRTFKDDCSKSRRLCQFKLSYVRADFQLRKYAKSTLRHTHVETEVLGCFEGRTVCRWWSQCSAPMPAFLEKRWAQVPPPARHPKAARSPYGADVPIVALVVPLWHQLSVRSEVRVRPCRYPGGRLIHYSLMKQTQKPSPGRRVINPWLKGGCRYYYSVQKTGDQAAFRFTFFFSELAIKCVLLNYLAYVENSFKSYVVRRRRQRSKAVAETQPSHCFF